MTWGTCHGSPKEIVSETAGKGDASNVTPGDHQYICRSVKVGGGEGKPGVVGGGVGAGRPR
jgi:hypothetical protein